jgi:pimeloyl-ACP methyl ester carboxylesterase
MIRTPTLMIWGEQDTALSRKTTIGIEDYVADLTLRYLPQASHWVQQDAPDEVNAILTAWLKNEVVPRFDR